jgi:hypothetical protein
VRHRTRHAPWEGGGPRNGEGLSASPDAPAPLCASASVGVLRREAPGSPAWCQASIPPVRTETVGKWCSRNSSAARTERPSVFHTMTRGRPRWGTSSLSRPSRAGKGSKTAPSMCPSSPTNSSGLRTSRTRGGVSWDSSVCHWYRVSRRGRRRWRMSTGRRATAASRVRARSPCCTRAGPPPRASRPT